MARPKKDVTLSATERSRLRRIRAARELGKLETALNALDWVLAATSLSEAHNIVHDARNQIEAIEAG